VEERKRESGDGFFSLSLCIFLLTFLAPEFPIDWKKTPTSHAQIIFL